MKTDTLTALRNDDRLQKLEDSIASIAKEGPVVAQYKNSSATSRAANSENGSQGSGAHSRPCFRILAAELRHMIYEAAFPERVLMFHPEGPVSLPYLGMRPLPPPSIALTCREAYHFSRGRYQQLRYEPVGLSVENPHSIFPCSHTWFNPDRDALLIDLEQLHYTHFPIPLFGPRIYNPHMNLTDKSSRIWSTQVQFSQVLRSLWSFTTVARHMIWRRYPGEALLGPEYMLMYGFSDAFPSVQQISFVAFEFLCQHGGPRKLNNILELEDSVLLVDPYKEAETNQVATVLRANILVNSKQDMMTWNEYLDNLRDHECHPYDLTIQNGLYKSVVLRFVKRGLARAQVYADAAYHITRGNRVYDCYYGWVHSVNTETKLEIEAREKKLPPISLACLVMEPAWELQEIATDTEKPSETELHWVRQ